MISRTKVRTMSSRAGGIAANGIISANSSNLTLSPGSIFVGIVRHCADDLDDRFQHQLRGYVVCDVSRRCGLFVFCHGFTCFMSAGRAPKGGPDADMSSGSPGPDRDGWIEFKSRLLDNARLWNFPQRHESTAPTGKQRGNETPSCRLITNGDDLYAVGRHHFGFYHSAGTVGRSWLVCVGWYCCTRRADALRALRGASPGRIYGSTRRPG